MFCWYYEILKNNDLLPNRQSLFGRVREIFWTWFLLTSMLKERCEEAFCQANRDHNAVPSAGDHVFPEWHLKGSFRLQAIAG